MSKGFVEDVDAETGAAVEAPKVEEPTGPFGVGVKKLADINSAKDTDSLRELGGVEGLAKLLMTSTSTGIDATSTGDDSVESRQQWFGCNMIPPPPPASFFALMWANLQDPIIILLIFAAAVSTGLGAGIPEQRAKAEWIEGVAIWVAVFLVAGVGAANDYQKDKQFRKLNAQREAIYIKVIRGSHQTLALSHDLVVGDIMMLDAGDKIVADCILVDHQGIVLDEASLTGESDPIKKNPESDPWIRSGTQVSEGSGRAIVVAIGVNSEWGKTMTLLEEAGDEQTPLQEKLEVVAGAIGKVGFAVAIACFIAMTIAWCVKNKGFPLNKINDHGPVQFFLYGITIIVVAVPEGLPLAVTISLAYSMKKMLVDQNFVRHLAACETMGGATAICSDKTGTLTENRMTVVEGWFAGQKLDHAPSAKELQPDILEILRDNISMNSKAFLTEGERVGFVGSSTECALLMLLRGMDIEYSEVRNKRQDDLVKLNGFTSARKMSSALMKHEGRYRLLNKGAAEWVLKVCSHYYNEDGQRAEMTPEILDAMMVTVTDMAKRGLRCICLTYADYEIEAPGRDASFFEDPANTDQNLTAVAIVGIKDPVRKEVPDSVATCQKAGIVVRMVTGDNIHTAMHIARECGILSQDDHAALEGPMFRRMYEERLLELKDLLPRLRVLARSSPEDKLTLVKMLKEEGEVVAVTGDGTNDAPALKESDVGLAMGIAGTEVAKEAADIIILDDNFTSIVKSVLWGRSVFNNIRKFLQFQLTVNCSALIICFIGAVVGMMEPLNVLQLLWVNLIMDTMGALALATEAPLPSLLDQKPHGREESLISGKMWKHIIVQGIYQVFIMLMCLYVLPKFIERYEISTKETYWPRACVSETSKVLTNPIGVAPGSYAYGTPGAVPDVNWYCTVMNKCGFPLGVDTRDTNLCPLSKLFIDNSVNGGRVSGNQGQALCVNMTTTGCVANDQLSAANTQMDKSFDEEVKKNWQKTLSVLFNAFIMCQIFNEINARRIFDEYDFFAGLWKSPIFISVLVITFGLQAIIMNFLGIFFKVIPLDWKEWLATIAVGFGSCIVSWITRWVSRNLALNDVLAIRRVHGKKTGSGRSASGRAGSGRLADGTNSMNGTANSHNNVHTQVRPKSPTTNQVVPV